MSVLNPWAEIVVLKKIEAHHGVNIVIVDEKPERTLDKISKKLISKKGKKAKFSLSTFWRFLDRNGLHLKKENWPCRGSIKSEDRKAKRERYQRL